MASRNSVWIARRSLLRSRSSTGICRGRREGDVEVGSNRGANAPKRANTDDHSREAPMIRKLQSGGYRLYSSKPSPRTGKRRNLGTFSSLSAAKKHEREIQYFKR